MKRIICVLVLVVSFYASAATGIIDLGVAFNYHPYVLLYYYPQYKAFQHPVKGKLTKSSIYAAEQEFKKKKDELNKRNNSQIQQIFKEIAALRKERQETEDKMEGVKIQLWEKQSKRTFGKSTEELRKLNLQYRQDVLKSIAPFEDKIADIDAAISELEEDRKKLTDAAFHSEFTDSRETKEMVDQIKKDIMDAVRKVAREKGLGLIINSNAYNYAAREPDQTNRSYAGVNFTRLKTLTGNMDEGKIGKSGLDTYVNAYIQRMDSAEDVPEEAHFVNQLILNEGTDITVQVVKELLRGDAINPSVKSAVIKYLVSLQGK